MAALSVRSHNETVLRELKRGDMVEFPRDIHSHWAIYIGNEKVVHMKGRDGGGYSANSGAVFTICGQEFDGVIIDEDDFHEVADQSKAKKNNYLDGLYEPRSERRIVEEALKMRGEINYDILWNNCEHVVTYWRYGVRTSKQAEKARSIVGAVKGVAKGWLQQLQ